MNYKGFKLFIIFMTFLPSPAISVERISDYKLDRKKVQKISLYFTKATKFTFPSKVEEIVVGLPNLFNATVSENNTNEINLFLKKNTTNPTNMLVRTEEKYLYAFDLVPSNTNHQYIVNVNDSFYGMKLDKNTQKKRVLLYQEAVPKKIDLKLLK